MLSPLHWRSPNENGPTRDPFDGKNFEITEAQAKYIREIKENIDRVTKGALPEAIEGFIPRCIDPKIRVGRIPRHWNYDLTDLTDGMFKQAVADYFGWMTMEYARENARLPEHPGRQPLILYLGGQGFCPPETNTYLFPGPQGAGLLFNDLKISYRVVALPPPSVDGWGYYLRSTSTFNNKRLGRHRN